MGHPATKIEQGSASQRKLLKLTRKRLVRFVTLLPKFLVNDDADTIHDLRVGSRRLQQALRTLLQGKPRGSRKANRTLRRVRKALGPCRNLDVNGELVQRLLQQSQAPVSRKGWQTLAIHFKEQREPLLLAARKQVAKHDLVAFIERVRKLIAEADLDVDPTVKLETALTDSISEWDEAFRLAVETRIVENLHALRIATKRLRYRAELLADSGSAALAPMLKDVKEIQTALGDWHDRSVLVQYATEFFTRPNHLRQHSDMHDPLLAEMEKEKQTSNLAIETILSRAAQLRKHWNNRHVRDEQHAGKA